MIRTCGKCPTELGKRNTSGLCRPCRAKVTLCNPRAQAKAKASMARKFADPVFRESHGARSRARLAEWRSTPEGKARLLEQSAINLAKARDADNEARKRAIRAAAYPGIPEDRWDDCVALSRIVSAKEAKRLIREDIASKERARLAAMTPFERQLERVRNGAQLVEKFVPRRADPTFTLGGVAPEAI